jgi:hypothetical protein
VHSTLHTNNYYDYVNRQLEGVQSQEDVIQILDDIGADLMAGNTPWESGGGDDAVPGGE